MNELRPKLFDVIKGYTKEQLMKDIMSGIIVAIIALPLSQDFLFNSLAEAVYRLAVRLPLSLLSSMASLQSMEPTV